MNQLAIASVQTNTYGPVSTVARSSSEQIRACKVLTAWRARDIDRYGHNNMRLPPFICAIVLSVVTKLTVCHNEGPIIGILTQEISWFGVGHEQRAYLAASYVKSIEASGGRVVPVFTNRTVEYYEYELGF